MDSISEGLNWLGISSTEDAVYQKNNITRHSAVAMQLLDAGHAYRCYCSPEEIEAMRQQAQQEGRKPRYDGRCRNRAQPGEGPHVIRFRTPGSGSVTIKDRVQGKINFPNDELDDLVIVRADGSPTYHLAVVVDDNDMGVTEVIRGSDHLNNTPRQAHIIDAICANRPQYTHLPLLLAANGKPMSKRDKAADILQYREQGFLPQAVVNFLARLGWSHGDQEIFSMEQLQQLFSVDNVNRAPARCDLDKLRWLNQQHIMQLTTAEQETNLAEHLLKLGIKAEGVNTQELVQQLVTRNNTFADMAQAAVVFYRDPEIEEAAAEKHLTNETMPLLKELRISLQNTNWQKEDIHNAIQQVVEKNGIKFGKLAQAVRVAACGSTSSPPIDITLKLIGKEGTLRRLDKVLTA